MVVQSHSLFNLNYNLVSVDFDTSSCSKENFRIEGKTMVGGLTHHFNPLNLLEFVASVSDPYAIVEKISTIYSAICSCEGESFFL